MKIKVNREQLSKKLATIAIVVNPGHSLPVCQQVLFEVRDTSIKIRATNLEVEVSTKVSHELVEGEIKSFVIPIVELQKTIDNLTSENIWIKIDGMSCEFGASESRKRYKVGMTFKATEYPKEMPRGPLKIKLLKEYALPAFLNAASVADKKNVMAWIQGVHLQCRQNSIRIAGLTQQTFFLYDHPKDQEDFKDVVIPVDTFQVVKILNNVHLDAGIDPIDKTFCITDGQYVVTARTIDTNTPEIDMIVSQLQIDESFVKVNKKELISSIKRVSSFRNVTSNAIFLNFETKEGENEISISSENIDFAKKAIEAIPFVEKENMNHITSLNHVFLSASLNGLPGETVKFDQVDSKKIIRVTDEKSEFLYYIAPLMLQQ